MTVESHVVSIETRREGEMLDITEKVQAVVGKGTIKNGVAFLFVPGSTAALTTIEYEPGLLADLPSMLERIVPREVSYEHERRWHDGNGHSQSLTHQSFTDWPRSLRPFRTQEADARDLAANRFHRARRSTTRSNNHRPFHGRIDAAPIPLSFRWKTPTDCPNAVSMISL